MHIRQFIPSDAQALWELAYQTIREINAADYTNAQVQAWAPDHHDEERWLKLLLNNKPYIAIDSDRIVGFADLQPSGYIDHFFCAATHIGQGVGRLLMEKIIEEANQLNISTLSSHVSITAKPFFIHFGFHTVKAQQVQVRGVYLKNYVMQKTLHHP